MRRHPWTLIAFVFAVLIAEITWYAADSTVVAAQAGASAPGAMPSQDDLQRSILVNSYREVANSGPMRGETIYFYKCWMCHNKFTIGINRGSAPVAPYIPDLIKRGTLLSGQPFTDANVAEVIKQGSLRMPSFRTTLTDTDIADLLSYFKSSRFPFEGTDAMLNPAYRAVTRPWPVPTAVSGGARGVVRTSLGPSDSTEGIKVQLIASSGVRTTVLVNEQGRYEFPAMQRGTYTLRIATPLEFKPYRRDVQIDRTTELPEIVLDRITQLDPKKLLQPGFDASALPPTRDIEWQLSDSELLYNLPGTGQEKETFRLGCSNGCHSYKQILRNRYDERSWTVMVERMMTYGGSALLRRNSGRTAGGDTREDIQRLAKWLAKVRGPEAVDAPYQPFPRLKGRSTRVVITEYELPRSLISPHDVWGDSKGNIWYTAHRSDKFGKLDPRTGVVTEYATPAVEGLLPGQHHVRIDPKRNDRVWLSENWRNRLVRFDQVTGEFKIIEGGPLVNFGMAPDGSIWGSTVGGGGAEGLRRVDPDTGNDVGQWDTKGLIVYDNLLSPDGNFWAGGSHPFGGNNALVLNIKTGVMSFLDMGANYMSPARGAFDLFGNAWWGGRRGSFIKLDTKTMKLTEYPAPNAYPPYVSFYEAMPDKNGEVWAGSLQGRGWFRYNPRDDRWVEYPMAEPYAHNRRTWIDNSTTPVTVWYVDHNGWLVRIRPLD